MPPLETANPGLHSVNYRDFIPIEREKPRCRLIKPRIPLLHSVNYHEFATIERENRDAAPLNRDSPPSQRELPRLHSYRARKTAMPLF